MKPNSITVYQEVAHAQLSDSSAEKRYEELCKSIPERGKRCLQHANSLMAEMWAMAEEVHELKGVCKVLDKAYEAEAIKLCRGETAFHYLRDLYTAFSGNRQKALACAKAPYTLLREFRAERAAKNREKKCQAAEQYRGKYYCTADGNAIYVQKTSATDGSIAGDMAGGGHTTVLVANLRDELTAEQYYDRKKEIENTRHKGAVYVQKSTGKRLMATGGFNGVWTYLIPEDQGDWDVKGPSEQVHYADLVLDENSMKGPDSIPVDGHPEMPDTGAEQALPAEKSWAEIITMQPEVIDVVVEPPASICTIEQLVMANEDAHLDGYNDATEKANAFVKCSLFEGDAHKAIEFLEAHFLEKPTDENRAASPVSNGRAKHATVTKSVGKRRAKRAKKRLAHKKRTAAKKRAATNTADTPWPPPIVCGEVSKWEEAKKGQYVTWGGARVMVIDDIQDSAIVLEDPFYPMGKYPIRVTRKTWNHVQGTTEDRVTSEFVRICGKVPASANSSGGPVPRSPAFKTVG